MSAIRSLSRNRRASVAYRVAAATAEAAKAADDRETRQAFVDLSKTYYQHGRRIMRGFTLIELVIGMAIVVVVLALAAPAFSDFVAQNKLATQTTEFVTAARLARASAVTSGSSVTICASNSDINSERNVCTGSDWSKGWIVFEDQNEDCSIGSGRIIDTSTGDTGISSALRHRGNNSPTDLECLTYTASGRARIGVQDRAEVEICGRQGDSRIFTVRQIGYLKRAEGVCGT